MMAATLSPATRRGLFTQQIEREQRAAREDNLDDRYEEVTAYRCTKCDELHELRVDAEECCNERKTPPGADLPNDHCPVCAAECYDAEGAAHHCLWHDFDHPTRVAMARKVEAGATWTEAIEQATKG